jgi:hypothetical protein
MNRIITALFLVMALASSSQADVLILSPTGEMSNISGANPVLTASTSAQAIYKTVIITSPYTIDDVTFPSTVALRIENGGKLTVNTGKTLTINGPFTAPPAQVVAGAGVVIGLKEAYPEWWGAKPDGTTDSVTGLQKAIDSVYATGGGTLKLMPGTYLLATVDSTDHYTLLKSRANVSVIGSGPASILKVANGVRTATAGTAILYNHADLVSDVTYQNFTVDYNGQNNLVLAGYNSNSKVSRLGADHAQRVHINHIAFKNAPGYHFIWLGTQADTYENSVTDCTFNEAGSSISGNLIDDHSSIFSYGARSLIADNIFTMSTHDTVATAIEFSGSGSIATHNTISNYNYGMNYTSGQTIDTVGLKITNNVISNAYWGIVGWTAQGVAGMTSLLADVSISGNSVSLIDGNGQIGISHYSTFLGSTTKTRGISITDNTIYQVANTSQSGNTSVSAMGINVDFADHVRIARNTIHNFYNEAIQVSGAAGGITDVQIIDNNVTDCGIGSNPNNKRAIAVLAASNSGGAINNLVIRGNLLSTSAGVSSPPLYGIYAGTGWFPSTLIEGNTITNHGLDIYRNSVVTTDTFIIKHVSNFNPYLIIRASMGSTWLDTTTGQLHTYVVSDGSNGAWVSGSTSNGIPTTGTYRQGSRVINMVATVGQPKAWLCSVSGTLGTLSGVTASGSSGSSTITVNTTSGLALAQIITIAGVSGTKHIMGISGTTVTLTSTIDATVSGAAVAYSATTLTSEGNL